MHNTGDWRRVSRGQPCPVCEKPDWCLIAGPENSPSAAICARIESPKQCGEAGWLHRLRDDGYRQPRRRIVLPATKATATPVRDWRRFVNDCEASLATSRLDELAAGLGVSSDALERLRVGWSGEHRAFAFPMFDVAGRVLGVRLRGTSGHKWSVRGGREGLFLPRSENDSGCLLVCEGPTDTAALVDLGFHTIGRPSCTGGVRLIVEMVQSQQPGEVVILADGDMPGMRGANNLASVLAAYVPSVRVMTPPNGVKDARDWKRQGATHDDIMARIVETAPRRLGVVAKGVSR